MAEILSVNVKYNDKIYKIGLDGNDYYTEDDGCILITLNWQKIAFDAITRLVDICNIDVSENDQNPPEYTIENNE